MNFSYFFPTRDHFFIFRGGIFITLNLLLFVLLFDGIFNVTPFSFSIAEQSFCSISVRDCLSSTNTSKLSSTSNVAFFNLCNSSQHSEGRFAWALLWLDISVKTILSQSVCIGSSIHLPVLFSFEVSAVNSF